MHGTLGQHDFEALSAWLDGELDGDAADEVERLVASDPDWKQAAVELKSLDAALGSTPTPPAPPADLTERILRTVRLHEDLPAYLDGELDADRRGDLETAIRADADLAREAAELAALDEVLDAWGAPRAPDALAEKVIAYVRVHDDLVAYADGELDGRRAAEVAAAIESDRRIADAYAELKALDGALDDWDVPAPAADLPERILAGVSRRHRRQKVLRFVRYLPPATAAAAAIAILAVSIALHGPATAPETPTGGPEVSKVLQDIPADQRADVETFASRNVDFLEKMDALEVLASNDDLLDSETLAALDTLERGS